MSGMSDSSRWRAKMIGRCPSLTNLRLASAPMTPIPPVIKTFMLCSVNFCADGADQRAPVLQIALNQLAKLLRREIDTLEAVGLEELLGLRMVQCLRDV